MRGKLHEKDEEMKSMKQQLDTMQSQMQSLIAAIGNSQEGKQEIARRLIEQGTYKTKPDLLVNKKSN
jgi:hypothetical protein